MSDRVDTEAVREWARKVAVRAFAYEDDDKRIAPIAVALCDELDRTREALRFYADPLNWEAWPSTAGPRRWGYIPPDWVARLRHRGSGVGGQMFSPSTAENVRERIAAAALAESGNTEPKVCPTCGEPGDGDCVGWGATDTEGEK